MDSRTLQSTPESGSRAGFDGAKRRRGSKLHLAVDTLGHLLALLVTPANEQDRHQVAELTRQVQEVTGDSVEVAFVDQAYTGEQAAQDAEANHMQLEVVKLPEARRGFVLLPRRWVVERTQGGAAPRRLRAFLQHAPQPIHFSTPPRYPYRTPKHPKMKSLSETVMQAQKKGLRATIISPEAL